MLLGAKASSGIANIEASLGGRDNIIEALLCGDLTPKQAHFVRLLMDPRRSGDRMATICADAGISARELLDLFRSAEVAKAHAVSLGYIAGRSLEVARDIIDKSTDKLIECPVCRGRQRDWEGAECKRCAGKGTILREADINRQKMVAEAIGISKKGGGLNINMTQQMASASPSIFSKFVKASDEIAYDVKPADVIDVEVTKDD